jgi:hypothetical protein
VVRALRDHRLARSRRTSPASWDTTTSRRWVDIGCWLGSFGLFFTLFLLFCRYLPMVAMAEVKTVMPIADAHGGQRRSVGDYHGEIPSHMRGGDRS